MTETAITFCDDFFCEKRPDCARSTAGRYVLSVDFPRENHGQFRDGTDCPAFTPIPLKQVEAWHAREVAA